MEFIEAKKLVEAKKNGTIRSITYTRPMKTKRGVTSKIVKTTTIQGRFGVAYDNIRTVMNARNNCELPLANQGLPSNLEWLDKHFLRNKKTGAILLRVAYANGKPTITSYMKDGRPATKAEIAPLCLAEETKPKTTPITVFNIGVDKILEIR